MTAHLSIAQIPDTVEPPLWVYDLAMNAMATKPTDAPPVIELTVAFRPSSSVDDLRIELSGPGVLTPTSATTADRVKAGHTVHATFRWSVPVRRQPPPFALQLTAMAHDVQGGKHHTATAHGATDVQPPPPPTEDAYVSDLRFDYVSNGYGPVKRDQSVGGFGPDDGKPLMLDGTTYPKGIGVNAVADARIVTA